MFSSSAWRTCALIPMTLLAVSGCNNEDTVTCGSGTVLVDGECQSEPFTPECGPGTVLVSGKCVPTSTQVTCGDGTELVGAECLPAQVPLEFEIHEEESGYAELIEGVKAVGADDDTGHLDQSILATWADETPTEEQLAFLFDHGDELTEIEFTEADGVGSLSLPNGDPLDTRFSRMPLGTRFTGPNGGSCLSCHNAPIGNAGGSNVANVLQDPDPGTPGAFNVRQTTSINGGGLSQILAEDMTEELQDLKQMALDNPGTTVQLTVKDGAVNFGSLVCAADDTCNYQNVRGVSPDLIVRPMGWKGNMPTVRAFSADAAFGEMGMQSDEVLWKIVDPNGTGAPQMDGDGDGESHELSVGDVTALTLYLALQEMPTTLIELADAGLAMLAPEDRTMIEDGQALFEKPVADGGVGCARCHVAEMAITTTEFMEPSPRALNAFEDEDLSGRDVGYTADAPLVVDLASELADAPRVVKAEDGSAVIRPYTDLKRHFMGVQLQDPARAYFPKTAGLADVRNLPADADTASRNSLTTVIGLGEFLTPELWGVGTTGPWLHDGRALTLRQAILLHGEDTPSASPSAAQAERDAFEALSEADQDKVIAFLRNLVLVELPKPPPAE
ncbi:MAG TPA: di-heme oxidoredictase family protein [Haliangium sp.]|nr:di-heme oxidoredictase family protein [Haliangium sp.]